MDIQSDKIEAIVKQVIANMNGSANTQTATPSAAPRANGAIPKTGRVAMLTSLEHFDIKEYPFPSFRTTIYSSR